MPPRSTRARGQRNEDRAARHLQAHGLQILDRNAVAGGAEIDLVARLPADDGQPTTLVFVEVRSRAKVEAGDPVETIGPRKRRQLIRGATMYLVERGLWERVAVRFDVIGIVSGSDDEAPEIRWIPGAFDADA